MRIQSHTRRNYLRLEIRFTRMVITLTVFIFISRLTILLVDLFVSYVDIFDKEIVLSYFLATFFHSFEGIFLIYQDTNLGFLFGLNNRNQ